MTTLYFDPPSKDAPGFLRRQRMALEFIQMINSDPQPETIDKLVVFLAPYVRSPNGKLEEKEAAEFLWDASENQFFAMLTALTGGEDEEENPTE